MKTEKIKRGLWLFVFAFLCAPFVQHCTSIVKSGPLDGIYDIAPDVTFSKQEWWEGTYQEKKNKYVNDNVGFRTDFIRINSQLYYTVYNMAWGALMGKEKYLFYEDNVNAYLGKDAIPYDTAKNMIVKLKVVQDWLEANNKNFVFVHAADKGVLYPEYLPDRPIDIKKGPTNREIFNRISDSLGLHYLDLVPLLISKKPTGPIYMKQSMHWSRFGAMYAVDTMIKYMEERSGKDLANPEWGNMTKTEVPRKSDNDLGSVLNLFIPVKETFYYPEIKFPVDKGERISAVYIGDSFMWTLTYDSLTTHTHDKWEFWYYFNTVYTQKSLNDEEPEKEMASYDWRSKLDSTEIVLMLYTQHNILDIGKVVDSLYDYARQRSPKTLLRSAVKK